MKRYNMDVEIVENNRKPEYISCVELFKGQLYMPKHDIVMWHRKMWTWIAVQHYMGSKKSITTLKAEFLAKHHFSSVWQSCFLCDEAYGCCKLCLVQWPDDKACATGLYHYLITISNGIDKTKNCRPYQFLALKELEIAMLPLNPLQEVR